MGESLVETPKIENKMGESVPCLQQSVSFGRFEHDSLCWERWSTFPSNKYLEEVGKCSTPGSVAQKKAYFEAHYKKIAARKAELQDEENKREIGSVGSVSNEDGESNGEKPKTWLDVGNEEIEVADGSSELSGGVDEQNEGDDIIYEREDLQLRREDDPEDLVPKFENHGIEKPIESVSVEVEGNRTLELQDMEKLPRDEVEERDVVKFDSLENEQEEVAQDMVEERKISEEVAENVEKLDRLEETSQELPLDEVEHKEVTEKENEDLVKSENLMKIEKESLHDESDKREVEVVAEKETEAPVKLENPKKVRKEMPVKKTNITPTNAKTKPASPMSKRSSSVPKSPILSTPKSSKPALSKTSTSATRPSSVKKQIGSTPSPMPKSSKPALSKSAVSTTTTPTRPSVKKETGYTPPTSKKATSLHMSLRLDPANSDADALTTTRKSLIMDRMGDKDIVKRAFKAFRNFSHLSPSSLTKPPATDQFGDKKTDKGSVLDVSQKKHEGITRAVKPSSPASGTRKTTISSGLYKTGDVDKRNGKCLPGSLGVRSQDQGHKQKEVSKNIEQKSRSKEAGKTTHLQSKVKLEKPAPVKTPNRENSKAKLSSSYNQGHGFFRGLRRDLTKSQA